MPNVLREGQRERIILLGCLVGTRFLHLRSLLVLTVRYNYLFLRLRDYYSTSTVASANGPTTIVRVPCRLHYNTELYALLFPTNRA
jgi:hypothetical protein